MPVTVISTRDLKRTLARLQPLIREYLSLEAQFDLAVIAFQFRPTDARKTKLRAMHTHLGKLRKRLAVLSAWTEVYE